MMAKNIVKERIHCFKNELENWNVRELGVSVVEAFVSDANLHVQKLIKSSLWQ